MQPLRAMSRLGFANMSGALLMSVALVIIEGHADVGGLGCHLKPCWLPWADPAPLQLLWPLHSRWPMAVVQVEKSSSSLVGLATRSLTILQEVYGQQQQKKMKFFPPFFFLLGRR